MVGWIVASHLVLQFISIATLHVVNYGLTRLLMQSGVWTANVPEQRSDSLIKEAQTFILCLSMGNDDDGKSVKSEKPSSPLTAVS